MMGAGLLDEVEGLVARGYGRGTPALSGLGYRQLLSFLDGTLTLDEAVERIKFETHRFARQQATWFRRDAPHIRWVEMVDEGVETAVDTLVVDWLAGERNPERRGGARRSAEKGIEADRLSS